MSDRGITIHRQIGFLEYDLVARYATYTPDEVEVFAAVLDTLRAVRDAEDRASNALATLRKLQEAEVG